MYINNFLRKRGLYYTKKYIEFLSIPSFSIDPLLNTQQPQISGQQNTHDFFDMFIYTYRFYRRFCCVEIAEFTLPLLT